MFERVLDVDLDEGRYSFPGDRSSDRLTVRLCSPPGLWTPLAYFSLIVRCPLLVPQSKLLFPAAKMIEFNIITAAKVRFQSAAPMPRGNHSAPVLFLLLIVLS